ncbi:helix-turn-helix transcriptional regulator [Chryseobacterium gallinarum]|uniref:AraC family transcriptional regulator n=1 Tax=Chryseobacterium gallinarum TaxID=1324352 RepID=UPI002023BF6F|nr:helix-turn-helix transcriptional regulator [Chryseobacterium gallinarum]MCL8537634.1 helix-turn-helix transcriptional regulator [Chryseobacterium gallinarum]
MLKRQKQNYFPVLTVHDFCPNCNKEHELLLLEINGAHTIEMEHRHDFFLFVLFERGAGVHTIDHVDYEIAARQIHLIFPDQLHKWSLGPSTKAVELIADRTFFESFSSSLRFLSAFYQSNPVISLSEEGFNRLMYEFDAIKTDLAKSEHLPELMEARCRIIALTVSMEAERNGKNNEIYQPHSILDRFTTLVEKHYKKEKLVRFYAEQLNITPNYLNIICKKKLLASATQIIQNRVILEAKRLLLISDLSIKEIAFDLNFYDHAYFANFFKTKTKLTPTDFRTKGRK